VTQPPQRVSSDGRHWRWLPGPVWGCYRHDDAQGTTLREAAWFDTEPEGGQTRGEYAAR
jgi:hypothetical protein